MNRKHLIDICKRHGVKYSVTLSNEKLMDRVLSLKAISPARKRKLRKQGKLGKLSTGMQSFFYTENGNVRYLLKTG